MTKMNERSAHQRSGSATEHVTTPDTLDSNRIIRGRLRAGAALFIGFVVISMAVVLVVRAHTSSVENKSNLSASEAEAEPTFAVSMQAKGEQVEIQRITLRPDGFEPESIAIPARKFFLAVDNRSGLTEMALRLDRQAGPLIQSVNIDHKKLDWIDLFELSPGTYTLSESNHPGLTCTITVTNK